MAAKGKGRAAGDVRNITEIPLKSLQVGSENVRKLLDDEETTIADLAQDIEQHGLLHPLTVRAAAKPGTYTIVAGQRRYLALRSLGRQTAPCSIVEVSDEAAEEMSLTENIHRAQLTTVDKVRTYQRLYELNGCSIPNLSRVVSVTPETLRKYIKIAALPEEILQRLDGKGDGRLTLETALGLAKLPSDRVVAAAAAVVRLPTNADRALAIKQIVAARRPTTTDIELIVDEIAVRRSGRAVTPAGGVELVVNEIAVRKVERIEVVPNKPWIPGRDGKPIKIPQPLYDVILDLIDGAEESTKEPMASEKE